MDNQSPKRRTAQRGPAGKTIARLKVIDEILSSLPEGQFISTSEIHERYNKRCNDINETENCVSLRQIQYDIHVLQDLFSKANPDKPNAFVIDKGKYRYDEGLSLFSKRLSHDEKILLCCLLPVIWKNRSRLGQCAGAGWDTFDGANLMIFSETVAF